MDAFADAGFGRFEIAWAPGTYGTPEQQADLAEVAKRAKSHGMQVDMTLGPGWPWSAPTTTDDLGQQELMYGREDVSGPTMFSGDVPPAIGDDQPRGKLVAVTAARVLEAGPPVTEADSPPESSTVLDPDSLVDLTAKTDGHRLTWDVPDGDWILFSFWQRPVEGCGLLSSGDRGCVSLIDDDSVRAGLQYVDDNQLGAAEDEVREVGYSFFEDSLELHADELYWTSDLPAEFTTRRGYDLTRYLPLMFAQGVSEYWVPEDEPTADFELPGDEGSRYRHDYYQTVTDLYLDNHIKLVAEWAKKYGMKFRTQAAYGNNFEVIRSSREAAQAGALVDDESLNAGDTPFLVREDASLLTGSYSDPDDPWWRFAMDHYRQVTSGSHQGGGLEVTSELGAWFGLELATSLRQYKRMMDKEWAAGVTRPLLHGVTHSPEGTPWPGASHFAGLVGEAVNHRTWPEWTHFKPLSDYWARGALVLQQGAARTDVAVLRDSFVTTAAGPTKPPKHFFDGVELEKSGFTIGYVDPVGVAQSPIGAGGELFPDGPSYDVLVVDTANVYVGPERLPAATAEAIERASAKGLKVVFVGDLPARGLSGQNPSAEDARVRAAVDKTLARATTAHVTTQAGVAQAVKELGVRPAAEWLKPSRVYSQLRETKDARYYLLWNATDQTQRLTGSFDAAGAASELDLWTGEYRPVALYRDTADRVNVPLELAPHATTVLMFPRNERRTHVTSTTADAVVTAGQNAVEVRDAAGGQQKVQISNGTTRTVDLPAVTDAPITVGGLTTGGPWQLQVTTYGPEGKVERPAMPLATLADWRTLPGLTSESGIGTYTTQVTLPPSWTGQHRGAVLDLGTFEGSVQVSVNGTRVTPDIDPQKPLDVTDLLKPGINTIQIVLATTPFNKAVVSPTTPLTRPAWPTSIAHGTQTYGLLEDVRILPYARAQISLERR